MKQLALLICVLVGQAHAADFELRDGDRVVFLGSEFTELSGRHGFLEAELTARWPKRRISFRNLGWSGDTPSAVARGYFGGEAEGFRRLQAELRRLKPTVVFLHYGFNSEDAEKFQRDFTRLLKFVRTLTDRVVVLTPLPVERLPPPRARPNYLNRVRQVNTQLIHNALRKNPGKSTRFINLYLSFHQRMRSPNRPLTWDAIRFKPASYALISGVTMRALGLRETSPRRAAMTAEQFDRLRFLIAEKNRLYFHRYRPQNETYLRGFRKHEQGKNAVEIAQFDPFIERAEERIAAFIRNKPLPEPLDPATPTKSTVEAADPETERAALKVAEGLEVSLFAAEPMIVNPIHMNFDGRGRLWVATSPVYPQIRPGATPSDQVIILEDTDGDQKADKRTVFADDLLIPTAVLPDEFGGAYVANSTELLHLIDTDGDGQADVRRVVLSGFGTEDTHHILHTFRWGPDGALYFNQSIYIHTHLETPLGVRRLHGSGIWRYQPETGVAEVVMRGLVNPWGHIFDEFGQSFATDGAGGGGINYAFPGAAFTSAVGYPRTVRGLNPGQPKFCGLEIVTGRHWPDDWQGTLVTNDFRGNRICRFEISDSGSGFRSRQLPDVITSTHRAFRPVDLKLGPDNALYVADWYNPIINHGEVDFRDPRRDARHGRIWRVTNAGRPAVEPPDIANASVPQLLEMLESPELTTRSHARRQLAKHTRFEVHDELNRWLAKAEGGPAGMRTRRLEAAWALETMGQASLPLLNQLLESPDHRLRAAGVRVMGHWRDLVSDAKALLTKAIADEHPRVRLEAVTTLQRFRSQQSAELAVKVLNSPTDANIDFAVWDTLRVLKEFWLRPLRNGGGVFGGNTDHILLALKAVDGPEIAGALGPLLDEELSAEQRSDVIRLVGRHGKPEDLRALLDVTLVDKTDAALDALLAAAKRRQRPTGDLSALATMMDDDRVLQMAGLWKVAAVRDKLVALAQDGTGSRQLVAIDSLKTFGEFGALKALAGGGQPVSVRAAAFCSMAALRPADAATAAAEFLASLPGKHQSEAEKIVTAFASTKGGAPALAERLRHHRLDRRIADAVLAKAAMGGESARTLVDVLRAMGSTPLLKTNLTPGEMQKLIADVTSGDPANGENIYRRENLACLKCHSIGGSGGIVGPDLISLGAASPVDYIVDSLLKPSVKIKEGYHTTAIVTDAGKQILGKLIREDATTVVLRDANNVEVTVPRTTIESRSNSNTSLMPVDLVARLPRPDFVDLVAFLSALGRDGAYRVPPNVLVRRWRLSDGKTLYSRVDGTLPLGDVTSRELTFEVDVSVAGNIEIDVTEPAGLELFLADQPVPLKDNGRIVRQLGMGRHVFKIRLVGVRRTGIRVELTDALNSPGRAVPVNQ